MTAATDLLDANQFAIVEARKVRRGQQLIMGDDLYTVVYDRTDVNTVLKFRMGDKRHTVKLNPSEQVVIAVR